MSNFLEAFSALATRRSSKPAPKVNVLSPEEAAELGEQLITASGKNDVEEIKRLLALGADVNYIGKPIMLGDGLTNPSHEGWSIRPTPLTAAITNGALDAALYLGGPAGADATLDVTRPDSEYFGKKAFDFLISDYFPKLKKPADWAQDKETNTKEHSFSETNIYTPEQRVKLMNVIIEATPKRRRFDLITHNKYEKHIASNFIAWGRFEMIPGLEKIGVKFENSHFIQAANPSFRPEAAIPTMEAIFRCMKKRNPLKNVSTPDNSGTNAGHHAAWEANLPALEWLEENGLDKTAKTKGASPTYAHHAAVLLRHPEIEAGKIEIEKRIALMTHIIENNYAYDQKDHRGNRPVDVAINYGNVSVALVLGRAGVELNSYHLMKTIVLSREGKTSTQDIKNLIEFFDERGLLDLQTITDAQDRIAPMIHYNVDDRVTLSPIAELLAQKKSGLKAREPSAQRAFTPNPGF